MFDRSIVNAAIEYAARQGGLANSPVEVRQSSEVMLCAASVIAYAGLKHKYGKDRAESFAHALASGTGKHTVEATFAELGWPVALCTQVMIDNDGTDPESRVGWFRTRLLNGSSARESNQGRVS